MKTIKFVLPLALALTLASCGNAKNVTRAEAEKLLQDSSTAVSADTYAFPTKFTLSSLAETTNPSSSALNLSVKSSVAYDEKSQYCHVSIETMGSEVWSYVKDDKFITATSISAGGLQLKSYTSATASDWKKDSSVSSMMTQAKNAQSTAFSSTLSLVKSLDEESTSSVSGASYELKESYTSTGAGNLTLTITAKLSSGSMVSSGKTEFSMDNNLFSRYYMEANDGSSSMKSEKKIEWNKCDLSYPNLAEFSKTL